MSILHIPHSLFSDRNGIGAVPADRLKHRHYIFRRNARLDIVHLAENKSPAGGQNGYSFADVGVDFLRRCGRENRLGITSTSSKGQLISEILF